MQRGRRNIGLVSWDKVIFRSSVKVTQKYDFLKKKKKKPCVCFVTECRHGLCGCLRQADVCLCRKPPKMTTWENYNFQTITRREREEKKGTLELDCSPQTEICIADTQYRSCTPSTKIYSADGSAVHIGIAKNLWGLNDWDGWQAAFETACAELLSAVAKRRNQSSAICEAATFPTPPINGQTAFCAMC